MRQISMMLAGTALAAAIVISISAGAQAEQAGGLRPQAGESVAQSDANSDVSAQRRPRRIQIYPRYEGHWQPDVVPRYNPGPNAVRVCNASYVPEHRPSGTVIVPHMSCYWRRG
jgi:lipoprotein-anchoring transpeptidase ErfK/SrfK